MCGCGFILIVCANKRLIQETSLKAQSSKATLSKMPALKFSFVFSSHTNCVAVCKCVRVFFVVFFLTSYPIFLCPTDCGLTGTECSHPEKSGIR